MEEIIKPGNSNTYAWEGDKGMEKSADLLNDAGTVMKATVVLAPIGEGLTVMSDAMKTALDYKNLDAKTATKNAAIRLLTFGAGKTLDKAVDGVEGVKKTTKEAVKIVNDQALDKSKEETINGDKEE